MYGEQGISVHVTANNEEILIGAPGIFTWKGSVIRHRARPLDDFGGMSRREQDAVTIPRHRRQEKDEILEYVSEVPNPLFWEQEDNSYFGFAVSSGFFDGRGSNKMLYVASAPQANSQQGEVRAFEYDFLVFRLLCPELIRDTRFSHVGVYIRYCQSLCGHRDNHQEVSHIFRPAIWRILWLQFVNGRL